MVIDEPKLATSIELFIHYYERHPEFYVSDERGQKDFAGHHFQAVFSGENIESSEFLPSMKELFSNPSFLNAVIWLGCGAFYQSRTFIDFLTSLETTRR
jgi:hypothetical protein